MSRHALRGFKGVVPLAWAGGSARALRNNSEVSGASEPAGRFSPVAGLAVSGGALLGGLGLSAGYLITGIGLPCAFRALTGWSCPFCGGTRMGAALLDGDLASAFAANPLALSAVAVLIVLAVCWAIESVGGPAIRPPAPISRVARRLGPSGMILVAAVLAMAYAVLRNLG